MDAENDINFECIRCGNCCTDPKTIVNLTYSDIIRIKSGLKLNLNELLEVVGFYIFDHNLDENTKKRLVTPPLHTERGLSYIGLLKDHKGKCFFFDSTNKKCKIYPLRPNFCKTFPFSFGYKDDSADLYIVITKKAKDYCLGFTPNSPPIDRSYWLKLGEEVLKDLKHNSEFIAQWNLLVKKKKLVPSAKQFLIKVIELEKNHKD